MEEKGDDCSSSPPRHEQVDKGVHADWSHHRYKAIPWAVEGHTSLGAPVTVISLSERRQPVRYTMHVTHHWDGTLELFVEDVGDDQRSRDAAANALRRAADLVERGDGRCEF